jgi:uncharacterized protein (DUF111 family)
MKNDITENAKAAVEKLFAQVKQERDEIVLKTHLFQADAKDEWHKVDKEWEDFKSKAGQVGKEAKGASDDVSTAAKLLAEEIMKSFQRIRKSL